jgi:tetratricopeptide (TPR) repeat protein
MRSVFHCLTGIALLSAGAALAVEPMVAAAPPATTADSLAPFDKLFSDLKRERNEKSAERISQRIWEQWTRSGSASIDLMMQWSDTAMKAEKFGVALDFLDRITVLQPDFAEGWHRRATGPFMMKNYEKSMADIERTLRLEPRHYGALSGMAEILKGSGRQEMALKAYQRALDVYPMLRSAQNEVAALSEELAGEGI